MASNFEESSMITHGLAGVKMSDKIVVRHHLLDAVGEGEGDGEGQALRHRHHKHSHADDDELDVVVDVIHVPIRTLTIK